MRELIRILVNGCAINNSGFENCLICKRRLLKGESCEKLQPISDTEFVKNQTNLAFKLNKKYDDQKEITRELKQND